MTKRKKKVVPPAVPWIRVSKPEDFKPNWQMAAGALMALGRMDIVEHIGKLCEPGYVFKLGDGEIAPDDSTDRERKT